MNANDRKQAAAILSRLHGMLSELESLGTAIEALADAEQEKFDNMSEGLQQTEKGQAIETAADLLRDVQSACESGNLQDAIDALENIDN